MRNIIENLSRLSHVYRACFGRIALTILWPSNGGTGIKLKNANTRFIVVNVSSPICIIGKFPNGIR